MREPETGGDWVALTSEELPVAVAYEWVVRPDCGAVVMFSGTVRDHAEGRVGITRLAYEAYEEHVVARLEKIAAEIRRRWPVVGRVVLWHRVGELGLGESSVVVAVSSPHRGEAFDAARFGIDTLKATAPIWKKEHWGDDPGSSEQGWALAAQRVSDLADVVAPAAERER